jgi:hypothetical protein
MAVTGHVFPQFMLGLAASDITLPGGTWKVALSNTAGPVGLATSGVSTAQLFTDWTSNVAAEISGTGYSAGGVTVASPSFTAGGANNSIATFTSATNPAWTVSTFSANQAILYQSSAATYQLAAFWDFGGAVPVVAGTLTLTINASGLLTATVS